MDHEILLKKLEMYGIADKELHRFSSYLKNRKQTVFFQQESSEFKEVLQWGTSGLGIRPLITFTVYQWCV